MIARAPASGRGVALAMVVAAALGGRADQRAVLVKGRVMNPFIVTLGTLEHRPRRSRW